MQSTNLDFPPIYLLPAHLSIDELHKLEDQIPNLTYDINEARIVLGKVATKQRAQFELRSRDLYTEDSQHVEKESTYTSLDLGSKENDDTRKRKRSRESPAKEDIITIDSSTESEDDQAPKVRRKAVTLVGTSEGRRSGSEREGAQAAVFSSPPAKEPQSSKNSASDSQQPVTIWGDTVKVVKLAWFMESLASKEILPLSAYLVYEGKVIPKPASAPIKRISLKAPDRKGVLFRAKNDAPLITAKSDGGYRKHARTSAVADLSLSQTRPVHLFHQTTSEHDDPSRLPPVPDFLHNTYSCERPTPSNPPNGAFIDQLKKIRHHRKLTFDEIGVRAYSTSIASLAAYPYAISSPYEVTCLPGCDDKIALLFHEWRETGKLSVVEEIEGDPKFQILDRFYDIWGVAEKTAFEFYNKGYVDLDDVVENEWPALLRPQQIGVKYYDEFKDKIPRTEVEEIGKVILSHANKLYAGFEMCIVGGYRRGKTESGDVDVVLSHPDEIITQGFIEVIENDLFQVGWITHSLSISTANSERGQMPVAWKGDMKKPGSGFDTLDKALVVWQNPTWSTKEQDIAKDPKAKNPNVHRRVDIIISPWKTAGCAIMGWTSGTTFQRDLRRYCKKERGVKFDSSGIRSNEDGTWVDFESGVEGGLIDKEKAVFKGLGLEWREPEMRCTG